MRRSMVYAFLLVHAASTGCATYRGERGRTPDPNLLTHTQLVSNHFHSAYEALLSLRANWLQGRKPEVYLDDVRLGGIESLRWIDVQTVSYIRRQDSFGALASSQPGVAQGAIYISTHPVVFR